MRTITIELPDETQSSDLDTRMRVAVELYNQGIFTLGQCAALVGLDRRDFMEKSAPYGGLKMGPQTLEEPQQDIDNADRFAADYRRRQLPDSAQ